MMKNKNDTTTKVMSIEEIKTLMQPVHSDNHCHTALIDTSDGRRALNLAFLRWAGGAKQVTLTQWELPPDAVGRIYTVDIFIGKITGKKYTDWAKGVQRKKRGKNSVKSGKKGDYIEFEQIQLDYLHGDKKRIHRRPALHTIIAYAYPPLREQYACAIQQELVTKGCTFYEAWAQVNHKDKDILNNSACNFEGITGRDNSIHRYKTFKGMPYSMICNSDAYPKHPELIEYYSCGITDAKQDYIAKLCAQLSAAQLDPDTAKVDVVTVNGKIVTVNIEGMTIWGILAQLFNAKTHTIASM